MLVGHLLSEQPSDRHDLTAGTPRHPPQNDPDDYVALKKTLDPQYLALKPANLAVPPSYAYSGMAHPPPAAAGQDARCNRPWSAPFLDSYTSPSARAEWGSEFKLTMCNWWARAPEAEAIGVPVVSSRAARFLLQHEAARLDSRRILRPAGTRRARSRSPPARPPARLPPAACASAPLNRRRLGPPAPLRARYLPQGAGALGIHRFLWQLSYLVSQGNYIFVSGLWCCGSQVMGLRPR
jgi:hypothetical protein